ncbi:MAG: hypothetical protein NVSMB44_45860 [Ktedonobacteraceae bacterium]
MVQWASEGQRVPQMAARLEMAENTVRNWLHRFNEQGLSGICDEVRTGRPPTYSTDEVSMVVVTALTKPDDLSQPFGHGTLDRLEVYLNEEQGIAIKRSRINEILQTEGLRWRKDEHWFGERVDPDFAQKRGSSPRSTRPHQKAASS